MTLRFATTTATAIATAALISLTGTVSATAQDSTYLIAQGDRFFTLVAEPDGTTADKNCTVGLNDVTHHASLTAAHCGETGDEVFIATPSGDVAVGRFYQSPNYQSLYDAAGNAFAANDMARIEWYNNVVLAPNIFTGDHWANLDDLYLSDRMCFHGSTTHAGTRDYTCGPAIGIIRDLAYGGFQTRPGDSGGPVWVENKGFVGVVSISGDFDYDDARTVFFTIATNNDLNPQMVTVAEEDHLFTKYMDYSEATNYANNAITLHTLNSDFVRPAPQPVPQRARTESPASSSLSSSDTTRNINATDSTETNTNPDLRIGTFLGTLTAIFTLLAALAPFALRF